MNILNPIAKGMLCVALGFSLMAFTPAKNQFSAAEQQQISIATPGLFDHSNAFNVDFDAFWQKEYSFPLPVGKAQLISNNWLKITTTKGDAVKAMFEGYVRLSRKTEANGNVIVIRHDNGLETVYANNAENLVKVGAHVDAGQTIAIVGGQAEDCYCDFAIMVNGNRINPETIVALQSHRLRRQMVQFRQEGGHVSVKVLGGKDSSAGRNKMQKKSTGLTFDPDEVKEPFAQSNTVKLDLDKMVPGHWAYPLPDAKVISPYGGRRHHTGVDLKTKPNDEIVAAFDGEVVASGPYYGYGNCIRIRHAYGFETLYSHQSKNLVEKGDKVKAGQPIGLTGRTGRATTEHLHFEVSCNGRRMDPAVVFDHANHQLKSSTLTVTKGGSVKATKNQ